MLSLLPISALSAGRSLISGQICRGVLTGRRTREAIVLGVALSFAALGAVAQMVQLPQIDTVAGTGTSHRYMRTDEGVLATSATISPYNLAVDRSGNLYIADPDNFRVYKVTASTGEIATIAGIGHPGYHPSTNNGPATSAFLEPSALAIDSYGNLYIADAYDLLVFKVAASTGVITVVAGNGNSGYSGDGGPATSATFQDPASVAVDNAGNLYICDCFITPVIGYGTGNGVIRKVTPAGIISTVAGNHNVGYYDPSENGSPATSVMMSPISVSVDGQGNIYTADYSGYVLKVTAKSGIITAVAGNGTDVYDPSEEGGPATAAGVAAVVVFADSFGNLYLSDPANERIFKVTASTGFISTIAGYVLPGAAPGLPNGGPAGKVEFASPNGVAVDSLGNVFVADYGNAVVDEVTSPTASISLPATAIGDNSEYVTLYLQPTNSFYLNGFSTALSQGGAEEFRIGPISGCTTGGALNGISNICQVPILFSPSYPGERDVALSVSTSAGNQTFALSGIAQGPLAVLTPGIISTVAGNGKAGYVASQDGGLATAAEIKSPAGMAVDSAGNQYIADTDNNRVRRVSAATGIITTVAGTGTAGYLSTQDGHAATAAELNQPAAVAVDGAGNLYISDFANNRVRKVTTATGIITTVAGTGTGAYEASQDGGPATAANIYRPVGLAVDSAENLYIADYDNNRIRKVSADGAITTVAGNGSTTYVASQDGGPAISASLELPYGVAVDAAGNLYISDLAHNRVRKVAAATGIITTVAGNGTGGYVAGEDGGPATSAEILAPQGLTVDAAGNLYFADAANDRIRKVTAVDGVISTVAGNGTPGYVAGQDGGGATSAQLTDPSWVSIDSVGNLFIADAGNNRIRKVSVGSSALSFSTTEQGATSSDSPRFVRLGNSGNTALPLPVIASSNPSISSGDFKIGGSTTCPVESSKSYPGSLSVGDDCAFAFDFSPREAGNLSATATLFDFSLGALTTQTIALSGTATSGGKAQTITFPEPAEAIYPGSAALAAQASSGLAVTYSVVSGPATVSGSKLTYSGTGMVAIMASQAGNNTYAPAKPVVLSISVKLAQDSVSWLPSTLKIYAGTALGASVLDAKASVPAGIAYSAYLLPSGSKSPVTASTVLKGGSYELQALITPNNTAYGATLLSFPFTVQNMNVVVANQAGSVTTVYNNATVQSAATSGGGKGAAVDASGNAWSINANGNGVSKFTDAGGFTASFSSGGVNSAIALAIDGAGTVWVADGGESGVSSLTNAGVAQNSVPIASGVVKAPASVSIDTAGSLWLSNPSSNTVVEVIGVAAPVTTPTTQSVIDNTLGTKP